MVQVPPCADNLVESLARPLEKMAARHQKRIAKIEAHREKVIERVEHHREKVLERREKAIAKAERRREQALQQVEMHCQRALAHREKALQKLENAQLEVLNKVTLIQYGDDGGKDLDAERKAFNRSHHTQRFTSTAADAASEMDIEVFDAGEVFDTSTESTPVVTPSDERMRTLSSSSTDSSMLNPEPVITSANSEWSRHTAWSRRDQLCDVSASACDRC
jgi:hypothetical protein